ncbi:hypothetical protein V1499_23100 (plasmid) [Neobacillus sp. SCS-31]|uniref:hypothetical protein n=1 Tax=Neobacillus oceani TaxID=3115292 RepID=UPI003905A9F8
MHSFGFGAFSNPDFIPLQHLLKLPGIGGKKDVVEAPLLITAGGILVTALSESLAELLGYSWIGTAINSFESFMISEPPNLP